MGVHKKELTSRCTKYSRGHFLKSGVTSLSTFKAELLSHCPSTAVYDIKFSSSESLLLSNCGSAFHVKIACYPIWDMWDGSVPPRQQPVKVQGAKFKTTKSQNENSSSILKILFSLIQPQGLISKTLYSESTTNDYVRSPPTHRKTQPFFQPKRGVTKSTNIGKINH